MPGTVPDTEKHEDEYHTVLEVFPVLLGKLDARAAK